MCKTYWLGLNIFLQQELGSFKTVFISIYIKVLKILGHGVFEYSNLQEDKIHARPNCIHTALHTFINAHQK